MTYSTRPPICSGYHWRFVDGEWLELHKEPELRYVALGTVYVGNDRTAQKIGRRIKVVAKSVIPSWELECLLYDI